MALNDILNIEQQALIGIANNSTNYVNILGTYPIISQEIINIINKNINNKEMIYKQPPIIDPYNTLRTLLYKIFK